MFSSPSQHPQPPKPTICSSLALCTVLLALAAAALDVVGAAASDSDGKLMVSSERETDKGGIKMWCLHNFGLFYPYHSFLHSVPENIFIQLP